MDGVFVAYHNTAKLFGFQYIPLVDMDERLFGSSESGERVFEMSVSLMEALMEEITVCFPNQVCNSHICSAVMQFELVS